MGTTQRSIDCYSDFVDYDEVQESAMNGNWLGRMEALPKRQFPKLALIPTSPKVSP